ncbi:MAG TPA: choice-of-anchor D domain-containing protein [Candidatus Eremiobacteraceae bacterium]|nr:choice-of-anchor D domain-containing protein [Candidatus Eremiobacteraceae bacterium]
MRPPQSIIRYRFFRTLHFLTISLTISLLMAPVIATASSPQFTAAPSVLHFRGVEIGQSETLIATVTNNGTTSVTVAAITSSNPVFTASPLSLPMPLAVGQSVDVSVSFAPTTTGWTYGAIKLTSADSSAALMLNVDGGGQKSEALTISPSFIPFGQVAVGSSSSVPVVVTNARSWNVTITGSQMMGSQFSMTGATFPLTLGVGQSMTMNVIFSPQSAGEVGGSLALLGPWMAIPLTGTGTTAVVGQLSVAPTPLTFGSVPVGTTQTQSISMNATGASVTVSSAASSSSEFVLSGASFPFTIPVGQPVSFNVAFTPSASGAQSGSLSFVSNASTAKTVESVSGTGAVTAYSVNLWWNSSSDVVGYNIYRSSAANGTFAKINPALNSTTAFTDSTVASGNTYYYAATSVNSVGMESARSASVQTTIP